MPTKEALSPVPDAIRDAVPKTDWDGFFCRDCGHEDNERDPRTGEVVGPLHVVRVVTSPCGCPLHADVTPVLPDLETVRPRREVVNWCLVCGRACRGGFRYRPAP